MNLLARAARPIAGVAFIGWLIGCGLIASARWFWIGELATHFQPFLGAAGVVLAPVLLIQKRRRAAIVAVLIGGCLLAPMIRFLPVGDRPEGAGQLIRVATLNMHRDRPGHLDFNAWFARHQPDIIAFQEVSAPTANALTAQLRDRGTVEFMPADLSDWTPGIYGQVFFCRFPVRSLERVHDGWRGGGLFDVHVDANGHDLHVVCGQPIRPGGGGYTAGRDQALARMATLAASHPNTVLLGDLNTTSFSPVFQALLDDGDLRDSRAGIGWQPSFSPLDRLPFSFPLLAIDHVLLGDELVAIDRQVTETIGSDHWPVIADIKFALRLP